MPINLSKSTAARHNSPRSTGASTNSHPRRNRAGRVLAGAAMLLTAVSVLSALSAFAGSRSAHAAETEAGTGNASATETQEQTFLKKQSAQPLQPVDGLDLERYVGGWFEIAKYPNFFQRDCASNVHAEYTKRPDGQITVLNSCLKANGAISQAEGLARPDTSGTPMASKLEVRFAPAWISWLPFVWGKYWVVMLDPAYNYAVVSEPSRKYLWILSRTPQMERATYEAILKALPALGLDPMKLQKTIQTDKE